MSALDLDLLTVPCQIRAKLRELDAAIAFDKQSTKGASSWLFFGTNRVMGQRVAVKFYDWGGDPRYHAEPRYLVSLSSDHVIRILDAAVADGDYAYFVTPFCLKGDVDDEIARGIRGNLRAVGLVRDVLSGLSHLHANALLHRDLKPQNILLTDDDRAVIGDFGSVKRLPSGHTAVPGSGHSLIYRPPESVLHKQYGVPGDIYQVGVLLYQLLGGALPYEESAWLNPTQLKEYRAIADSTDRQLYATNAILHLISRGKVVRPETLPPWVCDPLRSTVKKACHLVTDKRYASCSEFLARLGAIYPDVHDWRLEEGHPTRRGTRVYRIVPDRGGGAYRVQKHGAAGWRNDNRFSGVTVADLVHEIEDNSC